MALSPEQRRTITGSSPAASRFPVAYESREHSPRRLSRLAVAALCAAVASLPLGGAGPAVARLFWKPDASGVGNWLLHRVPLYLPATGALVLGVLSIHRIRRHSSTLSGHALAVAAITVAAVVTVVQLLADAVP